MKHLASLISLCALLTVGACGGAPSLGVDHPGWKQPLCFDCHGKSAKFPHGGEGYAEPQCADCHGNNGAPAKDHVADRPACQSCHGAVSHVPLFRDPEDCRGCHAAR